MKWPEKEHKEEVVTRQAVEEVVSVEKIDSVVYELYKFTEHSRECLLAQYRAGEQTEDGGYRMLFGYGKNEKRYKKGESPECSCGLNDAYDKAKSIRKQIMDELFGK